MSSTREWEWERGVYAHIYRCIHLYVFVWKFMGLCVLEKWHSESKTGKSEEGK